MSRRRPADEKITSGSVEGSLLPTTSSDVTNGKQRTHAERLSRFFRTRPVSSLLLVFALSALALVTFWLGRKVNHTLSHMLNPHHESSQSHSSSEKSHPNAPEFANTNSQKKEAPNSQKQEVHGDPGSKSASGALNQHNGWNPPVFDENGSLDNNVKGEDKQEDSDQRDSNSSQVQDRICYRKFEPGKLGFDKTLCVTDEFYFDIAVGDSQIGRFKIGVFGEVVPKSAANFRALVTCSGAFASKDLCYRKDSFHRIVTNFVAQGGSKATGRSIYGATFREEKSTDHHSFLEHGEKGVVSWAEYPIGSQFFILIRNEAKYLDDNHVVFGIVTDGLEVVDKMHDAPRNGEEPSSRVTITDCGDAHPATPK